MNYKIINLPVFGDERGKHAHKNLEQIIVAIDGSCQFVLDDGKTREYELNLLKKTDISKNEILNKEIQKINKGIIKKE